MKITLSSYAAHRSRPS